MRRSRYSEEQIIGFLREWESGQTAEEVARRAGASVTTLYRWKAKYGGMEVADARRLKSLEDENARLKRLVGQQALDIDGLRYALGKRY